MKKNAGAASFKYKRHGMRMVPQRLEKVFETACAAEGAKSLQNRWDVTVCPNIVAQIGQHIKHTWPTIAFTSSTTNTIHSDTRRPNAPNTTEEIHLRYMADTSKQVTIHKKYMISGGIGPIFGGKVTLTPSPVRPSKATPTKSDSCSLSLTQAD